MPNRESLLSSFLSSFSKVNQQDHMLKMIVFWSVLSSFWNFLSRHFSSWHSSSDSPPHSHCSSRILMQLVLESQRHRCHTVLLGPRSLLRPSWRGCTTVTLHCLSIADALELSAQYGVSMPGHTLLQPTSGPGHCFILLSYWSLIHFQNDILVVGAWQMWDFLFLTFSLGVFSLEFTHSYVFNDHL